MRIPRPQLNYANVIATIALFVALGGAAVAAALPKNSVGTKQIKRGAVTAAKLKRGAVIPGKIAPQAVTAGKLGANAVLPGNLGNGVVGTEKLGNGSVTAAKMRNGVVTSNKLTNGAVITPKLADNAVNSAKLAEGSVSLNKLGKNVPGLLQTGSLESGRTLRGDFAVGGGSLKSEKNETAYGAVSYQFPLASQPTPTIVPKGKTTADCPGLGGGDNQMPQASPGHLCIYVTGYANINPEEPANWLNDTRVGFGLSAEAHEAGNAFAVYGLWAVTAQ